MFSTEITPTNDKARQLPYPHYSDSRFSFGKAPQLLYDDGTEQGDWVYSDRLQQWDRGADSRAFDKAKSLNPGNKTAKWWEDYLTEYYGKPKTIHKVAAQTDGGGYAIYVLCFS